MSEFSGYGIWLIMGGKSYQRIFILLIFFSMIWSGCVEIKKRIDVDPVAWSKFDQNLKRAVESVQGDPTIEWPDAITLVPTTGTATVIQGTPDRAGRIRMAEERQPAFEAEVAGLVDILELQGAREIQTFW